MHSAGKMEMYLFADLNLYLLPDLENVPTVSKQCERWVDGVCLGLCDSGQDI